VCDVTRLAGIDGPFDLALDLGCFHGIRSRGAYLSNLVRLLAPGGSWLMYGFFQDPPDGRGPGLTPADLALIESYGLRLTSRQYGTDAGKRPSAWLLYQRPMG
jgi:hypothetical protein